MRIETPRMILREVVVDDAPAMFELNNDPEVVRYTGDGAFPSLDAAREFFAKYREVYTTGMGRLGIVLKDAPGVVGFCGLRRQEDGDVDLGYRLVRRLWGRGLATEACRAVLADGFGRLGLERIVARAHVDNIGSHRVLEKIGMARVGPTALDDMPAVLFELHAGSFAK